MATTTTVLEAYGFSSNDLIGAEILKRDARLFEIAEIIESADNGPTFTETLALVNDTDALRYSDALAALEIIKDEIWFAVHGVERKCADPVVTEGKVIAAQIKTTAIMAEKVLGKTGFVNALFAVISKPEGCGIRSKFKNI